MSGLRSLLVLALLAALPARADDEVRLSGFVDTYYAWNPGLPASGRNFAAGAGTSAARANAFSIGNASLDIRRAPSPVGFHLTLGFGNGLEVVHAGEVTADATGVEAWRHLTNASVQLGEDDDLQFELGLFPSHIGLEGFTSKDNWTYTRSWMGELSPYYQTGLKIRSPFGDDFHWEFHLLNGWQKIGTTDTRLAYGGQIGWAVERTGSLTLNGYAGPEKKGDSTEWRYFGDVVLAVNLLRELKLSVTFDTGRQGDASWWAIGTNARYAFSRYAGIAIRTEIYRDTDGLMTGTPQKLFSGTLTLEGRATDGLSMKLEGRMDTSTAAVFGEGAGFSTSQKLLVLGVVASF